MAKVGNSGIRNEPVELHVSDSMIEVRLADGS